MNRQGYEILKLIKENKYENQRQIAILSGYSLGCVNSTLKRLIEDGYLDENIQITEKARDSFKKNKPQRAVILAAGAGMRMVPINMEVPKGLLMVKGETLIERLIAQLKAVGIEEIRIVVGFMKENYEYLIDKYGVQLIFNPCYKDKNNLFSLAAVKDWLTNTYIVPCDIWCKENPFHTEEQYSWYMVSDKMDENSNVLVNRKHELKEVRSNGNKMVGIAYVCGETTEMLKTNITNMCVERMHFQAYWEDAAYKNGKMLFWSNVVNYESVFEINTYEELREIDEDSNQLDSELLSIAADTLKCTQKEIVEIEALKKGMTNRSFRFRCGDKRYIMRVPGEGTEKMINREQEYAVYQVVGKEGICDPIYYMDSKRGYKITEFLEDTRTCDAKNMDDVERCMKYLREVHQKNMRVDHCFDLYEQIEKYESYWNGEKSAYRDYDVTKEKIYELKAFVDKQEKDWSLTHIDAVADNFLIVGENTFLIDWEYSGMQDPHVDIAMFAIYALYDRKEIERLIDIYFEGNCPENVRTKIYCYISICGLLWSNWCEFKRMCGVEFGEYSLRQYRYAKEYYRIAKEKIDNE